MRVRRTVALVSVGVLLLTAASYVGCKLQQRRDDALRIQAHAKAHALKNELDARFTPGSAQDEVLAALKKAYEGRFPYTELVHGYDEPPLHYWIVVAQQPGTMWYCDRSASVIVSADFDVGRYVGTRIVVVPHGCL